MIIALCGNPNCGKTTLFNLLTGSTQRVGNYPGVTVQPCEGTLEARFARGAPSRVVDLPGAYALSPYTPEESAARDYIVREKPDVIVHIMDACTLARGLYLTLELMEMGRPMVLALNMMDALRAAGGSVNARALEDMLHLPVVPICARTGEGVEALLSGIAQAACARAPQLSDAAARYARIDALMARCYTPPPERPTPLADRLLTGRYTAYPLLLLVLALVLFLPFGPPGQALTRLANTALEAGVARVDALLTRFQTAPLLRSLIVDGALAGVSAVVSFLPAILLLFTLTGILEDTGFMARAAFILDAPMRRLGLSGHSFLPLMTGFGCSVPAILSVRTLRTARDRRFTALLIPFIPCGAKAPVCLFFASQLLPELGVWLPFSAYALGLAAALLASLLLRRGLSGAPSSFLLELPLYHLPTLRGLARVMRDKTRDFLSRAFTVVFVSALILWSLRTFTPALTVARGLQDSLLYRAGRGVSFVFRPLGFGTPECVSALIAGLFAKENIVSALSMAGAVFSSEAACLAFLAFAQLYAPCMAACAVLKRELNSRGRMLLFVCAQTVLAWLAAWLVYTVSLRLLR